MLATPRRAVGETRAEVEVGIPGALKMYIEDLHERGQVLPKPRNVGGYLAAWRPQPAAPRLLREREASLVAVHHGRRFKVSICELVHLRQRVFHAGGIDTSALA